MDIRDFNYWVNFKETCKMRDDIKCKVKDTYCIYVFCPYIKLDREIEEKE
ncbi:MAG: hypothetical protein ACTSSJ_00310 [Candidatus Odinarchaeia archaeon]